MRIDLVQYTLGLSGNFNPRLVTPEYLRYIFISLCSENSLHLNPRLAIPNYNARENSHLLRNPDTRNARDTPEPKEPPSSNLWGYFHNLPHISDKRVPKPWFRWCLLSWHRSRLGFVTPIVGEVSLGPLGNAHHLSHSSIATNELVAG